MTFAGIFHDDIYKFTPEQWDSLKIKGSYLYWYFTEVENVPEGIPYFTLSEYEAMGYKYYNISRGYIHVWAHSNVMDQFTDEQRARFVEHPKRNKLGDLVNCSMRYKYELTEEDKRQADAFWQVMKPYVHSTLKPETESTGA